MNTLKAFFTIGLLSLVIAAICSGSSYAQQTPGQPVAQPWTTELRDTVVNPHGSALTIPATTVHWKRRGFYGPYRGWYGGGWYGYKPYYKWYGYKPYVRKYWSGPYWYTGYYPWGKCWWTGYRWKCPSGVWYY